MILVTGITGKSGKWFLKRLIKEQDKINDTVFRFVVRNDSNTDLIDTLPNFLSVEKVYGDLYDAAFVDTIMVNVSTVLHIAGIHTSLNIVKAAVDNNVKRLILVHTTGIYSKYKSASKEYIETERKISGLISEKDINISILRPTMIYGSIADHNMVIFIKMVDKLRFFPVVNHARYLLQPVYEKDLGDAYYQVLMNEVSTKNKNYILSGKSPILLLDIFKTIAKYLGKKNIFISIPFPIAYFAGWVLFIISIGKIDYREKIQRLVEPRVFDHGDAVKDFGYAPVAFEDGIRNEIDEYKKLKVSK
jgi:nucleoside-diphosphate-sugar epimerase